MTAIVRENGELLSIIAATEEVVALNTPQGCLAVSDPPRQDMLYENGGWIDLPKRPSLFHCFDYTTRHWIDQRSLDDLKAQKWAEIKSLRNQLEFGGFEFEGNIYDSDQVSQGRIMGAAISGVDQVWTLADNTTVSLTASQLQQLYSALQAHIASVHERGRIARQLILDDETKEQVEAVQLM